MQTVKRNFQDFLLLRTELLYEMPELFLPTFQTLDDPILIDLKPPPLAWVEKTTSRFRSFMNWLQYHPILRSHDLVLSFVRSSHELQQALIRDHAFSRRRLLLEKIGDTPLPNQVMSTVEEEYFLMYAQKMMLPLKQDYLNLFTHLQNISNINRGN